MKSEQEIRRTMSALQLFQQKNELPPEVRASMKHTEDVLKWVLEEPSRIASTLEATVKSKSFLES